MTDHVTSHVTDDAVVPARGDDAGVTLIELAVSMSIMMIAMVLFTTGILQVFNGANKNESLAAAQSQINKMFLRLDREIRYASGISAQQKIDDEWYVEYLISNTGPQVCTELKLTRAGTLAHRTWTRSESVATITPTPWSPLADRVTAVGPEPFTLIPADATSNFHRLRLSIAAAAGSGGTGSRAATSITFTALNTSLSTTTTGTCTEGRVIP